MIPTPVSKQVVGEIHIQSWLTDTLTGKPLKEENKHETESDDEIRPVPIENEEWKR